MLKVKTVDCFIAIIYSDPFLNSLQQPILLKSLPTCKDKPRDGLWYWQLVHVQFLFLLCEYNGPFVTVRHRHSMQIIIIIFMNVLAAPQLNKLSSSLHPLAHKDLLPHSTTPSVMIRTSNNFATYFYSFAARHRVRGSNILIAAHGEK